MHGRTSPDLARRWTRAGLLRRAAAGGAVAAGGAAIGAWRGDGASLAAPSADTDAEIFNLFLLLEYLHEAFYREALQKAGLTGDLKEFARSVGLQEVRHVAFLEKRLGGRARVRPRPDFGDSLSAPERFRAAAIDLEELAIAAYIGQSANLTRGALEVVGTLLSVEARQVAWVLDLAGESPAPHAADPPRKTEDILRELRKRRLVP